MPMVLNDTGNIFVEFIFPIRTNQGYSILDGEYELKVYLCKCVCHTFPLFRPCRACSATRLDDTGQVPCQTGGQTGTVGPIVEAAFQSAATLYCFMCIA
jgi:hypothetical protein